MLGIAMRFLIFGPGYTASRILTALETQGAKVDVVRRDDFAEPAKVRAKIIRATHILSSVPPSDTGEPVLDRFEDALATSAAWLGYLSSTGVYGDSGGAWVDESAPTGTGRRSARAEADARWLALGARVFRLPGIYGPGRSPLDRIPPARVDAGAQVFSRVHVDDIVRGVLAGMAAPAGAYNLADDEPAPQSDVVTYACTLLGIAPPPLVPLADAPLSPAARAFYSENRRVANAKAKRVLGWRPRYADYRLGLRAVSATIKPAITNNAPPAAQSDQR